ncbi:MAG: hypothetical protein AB2826_25715 [Candidatus Thiodiazotropha sp.]
MNYINEMLGDDQLNTQETAHKLLTGLWVDESSLWEITLNADLTYKIRQLSTNFEYRGTWNAVPIEGEAGRGLLKLQDERYDDTVNEVSYRIVADNKLTLYNSSSGASRVFEKK